jgi:nucleoside-diphosphate-sugar epimerase
MCEGRRKVGILGADSLVGRPLISQLAFDGYEVKAFTRGDLNKERLSGVEWLKITSIDSGSLFNSNTIYVSHWVSVAPIWCLPDYFRLLEMYGAQRIVALSSTSIFTKHNSSDNEEKNVARMFSKGETELITWAEQNKIEWIIVRPTLIYGSRKDRNVSEIARLIDRFGFFPLVGKANGLRQPIHAEDVASVCRSALMKSDLVNRSYNVSGGEKLSYREMVKRIFISKGKRVFMPSVPLWLFRLAIFILRKVPRYSKWTVSMAVRMNKDLVFDHSDAVRDLSFNPRPFELSEKDI